MTVRGVSTMSMEEYWKRFHATWWDTMRENQRRERAVFEEKLLDTICSHWTPGPNIQSAVVVLVDFSVEGEITLHLYEKGSGHQSDIIAADNRELLRNQRMWGHVKVSENYGVKICNFELTRDLSHSYTVFSSNHIESIKITSKVASLKSIKWMYQENHPYIT